MRILKLCVAGIKVDEVAFLVGLRFLDEVAIFFIGLVLSVNVGEECKLLCLFVEVGL